VHPTDGTGSATYAATLWHLCVGGKTKQEEIVFCIQGLEQAPDRILSLCNQFLEEYGSAESK